MCFFRTFTPTPTTTNHSSTPPLVLVYMCTHSVQVHILYRYTFCTGTEYSTCRNKVFSAKVQVPYTGTHTCLLTSYMYIFFKISSNFVLKLHFSLFILIFNCLMILLPSKVLFIYIITGLAKLFFLYLSCFLYPVRYRSF